MLQTDDTTYTYDSRGNRTDIDIGTDNTDLTFNIADQLTRVDFEGTSYDIYTYDNNGNCTKKEHYSGTILIYPMEAIERMKAEKNKNLVHYPHLYAPTSLRTLPYLSPYLPNSKPFIDPLKWDIMTKGNDALKEQLIKNRWLSNTYPGLYTNNTQGASNTMLSSSLIPSCLSLPYDPSSSSSSDSSSSSSPSSSTSSNPSSPSSYSSLSSPISPYSPSSPQLDPDYTTTYEYDYEDRLKKITLPNDNTIEYRYDGSGKRLEKKYTAYDGQDTNITTYRYHMAGSQITQIDIDETHNLTPIKDEELLIHLGANTQPISITWVRHNLETQQTTSSTYYYHYDIHGNVLKLTDSSGVTKATYEYDTLGNITSQTNTDSVPNPFTYRGATQAIYDDETSSSSPNPTPLYFSSSSYKPDTGTLLQGTGAPASSNPSSSSVIELMAEATRPNAQLSGHAAVAEATGGTDSGGGGGAGEFSPPEGPSDGLIEAGQQEAASPGDYADLLCIADNPKSGLGQTLGFGNSTSTGGGGSGPPSTPRLEEGRSIGGAPDPERGPGTIQPPPPKFTPDPVLCSSQGSIDRGRIRILPIRTIDAPITLPVVYTLYTPARGQVSHAEFGDGTDKNRDGSIDNSEGKQPPNLFETHDKNGKLTSWVDNSGKLHIYDTNSDGSLKLTNGKPVEVTSPAGRINSWTSIVVSVARGSSSAQCYNSKGQKTDGSVSMCVGRRKDTGERQWAGIFVAGGKSSGSPNYTDQEAGYKSEMGGNPSTGTYLIQIYNTSDIKDAHWEYYYHDKGKTSYVNLTGSPFGYHPQYVGIGNGHHSYWDEQWPDSMKP